MVEASTMNHGETQIETTLKRSSQGILLTVKAHPRVEEFMRRISGGESTSVIVGGGRNWHVVYTDEISGAKHVYHEGNLDAYVIGQDLDFRIDNRTMATLNRLGRPLVEINERDGRGEELLNLSFLKIKGISDDGGVRFLLKEVISWDGLKKLRDQIQNAQNQFYQNYIKTIEYTVTTAIQTV